LDKKGIQSMFNGLNPQYADRDYTVVGTAKFHKRGQAQNSKGKKKQKKRVLCTYWTGDGRIFIYNMLKQDGILPLIEQPEKIRA